MATLGFNVDHIATIRQARREMEPDPVAAAMIAELHGITCVTLHLREDRRHIQDRDAFTLREVVQTKLNLEMAATDEMTKVALDLRPDQVTLVPEKREEITTEGGLDVVGNFDQIKRTIELLKRSPIEVSLFIDPEPEQIKASKEVGGDAIELHTGTYANAKGEAQCAELKRLTAGAEQAHGLGLHVHAGHGLTLGNVRPIAKLPHVEELNIGHSIVSRAVFVGLERAIVDMVEAIR